MRSSPPCQGWGRPSGLLPARSVRLAAPLALVEKVLLTDFCNRPFDTSTRGTFDFRARSKLQRPPPPDLPDRSPAERASCGAEPPCGNPTPDGHALDGAQPASASSPAATPKGSRAPLESGTPVAAGLSPACEVGESTSDTPCRARATTRRPGAVENQSRCYRPLVKMADFPDSECLPSKSALGSPRNEPIENPPPISRLCRRGVGFRRTFATRVLSHRGARPIVVFADSSPASAKGHAPLFDFCNRSAPRTRPPDRPNPAHRAPGRPGAQQLIAGGNAR